ncbi:hypothetical protein [Streptomyces sp. NPDC102462]|uniref:hypothetical protein n=1 Tax=Streptomyces sp. NPDC102462 TaxID=3366178 RepID=UPI003802C539
MLRPLWGSLVDGGDWGVRLERARAALGPPDPAADEAAALARRMRDAAPAERTGAAVRVWADACSVAALRVHRLVAAGLRRRVGVLELLAEHGAGGLRRALEVTTEGRRVLGAVVSRWARGRA